MVPGAVAERFWSKVDKNGPVHPILGTRCWLWTAATLKSGGYGAFRATTKQLVRAHRFAYELLVGPIPAGLMLDHACHIPACVRPDHLRPATNKQNSENISEAAVHSASGVRGVYWHSQREKWHGQVMHNRKTVSVGLFETIEDAHAAVVAKRLELFTHSDGR